MKKLTIKFIYSEFKKEGYTLLTKEYINSKQKLEYICPNGHKHSTRWSNWRGGYRCSYCAGNRKLVIEFIRSEFEKEGYKLLTKRYKNSSQKLYYICLNGHSGSISWGSWQQIRRCIYCSGKSKKTIEFIRLEFEKEGYVLLTKEYKNCSQKLEYICPYGHKGSVNWVNWNSNKSRCPICYNKIRGSMSRLSIDYIKSEFAKDGYNLLSTHYRNNYQKLKYRCAENHIHLMGWNSWGAGKRCPTCRDVKYSGSGNPNWKGGISCEPYCDVWLDRDFKESILDRDDHHCQNPDCWRTSKKLTVHHIDYNKKNCCPENLITVCRSCNARANFDRKLCEGQYSNLIQQKHANGLNDYE